MQEAVITLVYSAAVWFTGCVQNFDVLCGKIKENLPRFPTRGIVSAAMGINLVAQGSGIGTGAFNA